MKIYRCADCGAPVSDNRSYRCRKCWVSGQPSPSRAALLHSGVCHAGTHFTPPPQDVQERVRAWRAAHEIGERITHQVEVTESLRREIARECDPDYRRGGVEAGQPITEGRPYCAACGMRPVAVLGESVCFRCRGR